MKSLQHQHVMILGLGISGLAMARWCVSYGADVTVVDTRANPPQLTHLKTELPEAIYLTSAFESSLLDTKEFNKVLVSPGIKPADTAELLSCAHTKRIQVGNELTLFNMALRELSETVQYKPQVLAITGTNGKTTVTSLTGKLVAAANKTVAVAGNIGPSLLDTLSGKLDADQLPEVWVLELSSFQLNEASGFEPTAGVVLNVTQDHLDWHGSMSSYTDAKSRVYGDHGYMVINREDPAVMQMLLNAKQASKQRKYVTFGYDLPTRLDDYGLETVNGTIWLVRASSTEELVIKKQRSFLAPTVELHMQRLLPAEALQIRGQHNFLNALAALALAEMIGCSISKILYGLREYKGEPHRVESIGIFNGVEYFDDSKGTNVGATVAAISGIGKERKIVVILGGEGKGQDFSPLLDVVRQYVRSVVLIGKDKALIADALKTVNVSKFFVETMELAVAAAFEASLKGDAVLLSPACASLDMFENYEHRGQVFKSELMKLIDSAVHEVSSTSSASEEISL